MNQQNQPIWGPLGVSAGMVKQAAGTGQPPTAAQQMLATVTSWQATSLLPQSQMATLMANEGFLPLQLDVSHGESVFLCLRASASDVVELQSITATPTQRGHGTALMRRLCALADQLGVRIWITARPFGVNSITPLKLWEFYAAFGFTTTSYVPRRWLTPSHGRNFLKYASLMVREPQTLPTLGLPALKP